MMFFRACLLAVLVVLSVGLAVGQTVEPSAVAQPLLSDLASARTALSSGQSPWQDPAGRPQPEPFTVLREAFPGGRIWLAFKPVDQRVRRCYWLQRQSYLEKDAAVRPRREALELLPALKEAIRTERGAYNRTVTNVAVRQVAEVEYALNHLEYHAALCVLWSMADLLGLWDRQAALEVAADRLGEWCHDGAAGKTLRAKAAQRASRELEIISQMVETALAWKCPPESIGPDIPDVGCADVSWSHQHFADAADLGPAFDPWRERSVVDGSATPLVYDETNAKFALSFPAREVKCLVSSPEYRDWQKQLGDHRYGWSAYKPSAAQQKPCCDWRKLEPWATWPGAKGANNAGGL